MPRARRIAGWILAAALLCFAAALLALNLYVQSQGTQTRIQQELSQRLGMPLRVARISVTPWGGLQLSGITIPQTNPASTTPFLQASSFRLRVALHSIFQRPLVIKEVSLIKPQVVWVQNERGKWRIPQSGPPPGLAPGATAPAGTSLPAKPPLPEHAISLPQPEIKRVKLVDGSFHFFDRENRTVALFDGVQFSSLVREASSLRGRATIGKIALRDRVFLSGFASSLRYDPMGLELSGIRAQIARGQLNGSFAMQPQAEDSPFSMHATFRGVQADRLVAEAGGPKETVRGVLEGTLDAAGKIADPAALSGTGTIALRGGHVQQFALLAAIGQLLQIEELTQLDLQQAEAKYHLAGTAVLIDELLLRSPNLALKATGAVSFDRKLALDSTLTINEKIRAELFRGMRQNFAATAQPGEYSLPFHVGGTLDRPKTDLMERAVGSDLKNLGGVIDALFGRGRGHRNKGALPGASPTPTISAAPASPPGTP